MTDLRSILSPISKPVARIPVVCTGNDGEVYIDDTTPTEEQQHYTQVVDEVNHGSLTDRPSRDQIRALQSRLQG